jgi:electron transport complex protein RnfB
MSGIPDAELDAYERLAATLDKIPNGFPKVEDGTHLKVLKWIFVPEEAELASRMKLKGETAAELSSRLNLPVERLTETLETMVTKGQITTWSTETGRKYSLLPFVVGVYENQLGRMDEQFALLTEEYFQKARFAGLFDTNPPIHRIIPINRSIKTELTVYPYEQAEKMIKEAKSWGARDCICKEQQELIGNSCRYEPLKRVCLSFSPAENAFTDSKVKKAITMEDALALLHETEDAGLIHTSMNVQEGVSYICNCCTCCCGILRGVSEFKQPLAFVKSSYVASVDSELCVGCETCVDRCQFHALEVFADICDVDTDHCVGCGSCAIVCPEGALSLVFRVSNEIPSPPETTDEWMRQKAVSRNIDPSDLL